MMNETMREALARLGAATLPNVQPTLRDGALREVLRAFGETKYYTDPEEVRDRVLYHLAAWVARLDEAPTPAPDPVRWGPAWRQGEIELKTGD